MNLTTNSARTTDDTASEASGFQRIDSELAELREQIKRLQARVEHLETHGGPGGIP